MRLIDELMAHPLLEERGARKTLEPMGFEVSISIDEVPDDDERPDDAAAFERDPEAYMATVTLDMPEGFTELARFDTENGDIVMVAVKPTTSLAHLLMLSVDEAPLSATIKGAPTQASADVLAERRRQVETEGWSAEHDDGHIDGELAAAAGCYAYTACLRAGIVDYPDDGMGVWPFWPWEDAWWKPTHDPRRNLIKAGALILAEIERLDRQAERSREENS